MGKLPYHRKLTNHEINASYNINAVCEKFAFWKHKINAVLQKNTLRVHEINADSNVFISFESFKN